MKAEVTVTSERPKRDQPAYVHRAETEKYVSASLDVDGDARLVADALRALADSIWQAAS